MESLDYSSKEKIEWNIGNRKKYTKVGDMIDEKVGIYD